MVSSSVTACATSLASEHSFKCFFQNSIHLFERDIFLRLERLRRLLPFFVFRTRRLPAVAVSGAAGAATGAEAALDPTTDSFALPNAPDTDSFAPDKALPILLKKP
jgi:hypothetical protein